LSRHQAGASVVISAITLAIVATLIFVFRDTLLGWAGARGETANLASRYLAMTIFSLVPMSVSLVCSGVLKADGYGAKAMYVALYAGLVLMVIDPFLILWLELGLDGAAIGVVVFRILMMCLGVFYAVVQTGLVARPSMASIARTLRPFAWIAIPAIATQMATPAGNYVLTMVMSSFGDDAVAAWAVVSRLTVLAFGGIFALSGAIGGIFGQNYGAGQFERIRATYRDALVFCLIYTLITWAVLASATPLILRGFGLTGQGADVIRAFTFVGVGGFVFVGALFASNAAFNNLGKPGRSTCVNWLKDGVLSWPAAALLVVPFGPAGVIYGQAAAGAVVGTLAALWGWRYVASLTVQDTPDPVSEHSFQPTDRSGSR
jgi:Na+-driven multidrug efflux pump